MKKIIFPIILIVFVLSACGNKEVVNNNENESQIANPASVNCIEQGGELEIITAEDGGQYGVCKFEDGSECEEWHLFRNECSPGENNSGIKEEKEKVSIEDLNDWRTYEKEDNDVKIKYHKNWYYQRDSDEKLLGYELYVGFAESPSILNQKRPYPIALIITNDEFDQNLEYTRIIKGEDEKQYILGTDDKKEYGDMLDVMSQSLEVSKILK